MKIVKVKYLKPKFLEHLGKESTGIDIISSINNTNCVEYITGYVVADSSDWLVLAQSFMYTGIDIHCSGIAAISKRDILNILEIESTNEDEPVTEEFEKEVEEFLNEQLGDL